jgi:hypothetical protein
MKAYGWYFLLLGVFGIVTAFVRAKNEREVFLILATIPAAFLAIRMMESWQKRSKGK